MTTSLWNTVWARARARQHTVIVGAGDIPSTPDDLLVLWVHCNAPWTTGGPLDEVRHRVTKLLGDDQLGAVQDSERQGARLRTRLFDETPVHAIDARLVDACNRLASWDEGQVVLGLDAIDSADAATLATLTHILGHPGWLVLPLILAMESVPQGPVAELVSVIQRSTGNEAVVEITATSPSDQPDLIVDWTTLPPDVLRVLRAGSVLGLEFEAGLIARLLDEPVGTVLEMMQRAVDAGAVLVDRGDGRFGMSPEMGQALRDDMLPSLRDHWHAQLGMLLSEPPPPSHPAPALTPEETAPNAAPDPDAAQDKEEVARRVDLTAEEPLSVRPTDATDREQSRRAALYAQMFEPASTVTSDTASSIPDEAESFTPAADSIPVPTPRVGAARAPRQAQADQARAATHLQAAGQAEAAAEQYLAAARQVSAQGDSRRAVAMVQQALQLLDRLPQSERRALLQVQLLIELGREQWQSPVVGSPFTLPEALQSLEAARATLPESPPPDILGQLASLTAGVCYDLGDLTSLQHALNELTGVSRQLLAAGESMRAASLLNDQAAMYVRLGDPVRATHLLSESRGLFESVLRVRPDETDALEELAASEHLLARLALHIPIRPGREEEAYAISLEHAQAAKNAYEHLNQPWAVARAWETMGRLMLGQGHPEAARGRLMSALQTQKQMGDVTGLARTTAALADLCIAADQLGEASTLLADSVALNFEKGSPIGLAFNRRTFQTLQSAAATAQGEQTEHLPHLLAEVERRLVQAESIFGQMTLPGERSPEP